jgi:SAM-dependent methyltransferase
MRARKAWLFACPDCGFLASALQPGPGTGIGGLEALRRTNFEIVLDRLGRRRVLSGLRLLEVGAAQGWFLEAARRRGAIVAGIEPEAANAEIAHMKGLDVVVGFFPDDLAGRGPFDAIVFNDVFEHLPDPARMIRDVEALLAPGGLAVVNLPSSKGALFRLARALDVVGITSPHERLWQKGLPSPHVSYFSPANLALLVERHTRLAQVDAFALPSLTRQGLAERITASHRGTAATLLHAGLWLASFALPLLPADIHVAIFEKPGGGHS